MTTTQFTGKLVRVILSALLYLNFVSIEGNEYPCHRPLDVFYSTARCIEAPVCDWGYNPPAYGTLCSTCADILGTVVFRADFLWWRACEEGISLGSEELLLTYNLTPVNLKEVNKARIKQPHEHYEPGFRIGLLKVCPEGCWDAEMNWTHFHSKASAEGRDVNLHGRAQSTFIPYWERGVNLVPEYTKGVWKVNLDLIDLEFGRKFYISSSFVFRPFFGLRGARIAQSYRVNSHANRSSDQIIGQSNTYISHVHAKSDLMAIGPRAGLRAELQMFECFTLFGEASGAIVYGGFDRNAKEKCHQYMSNMQDMLDFSYKAGSSFERATKAIADMSIGVSWNSFYKWCNRWHPVSLAFSWEHHAFYGLNAFGFGSGGIDMRTGELFSERKFFGNLYTQGLTMSATIKF